MILPMAKTGPSSKRYSIGELGEIVDRRPDTIRKWESPDRLPQLPTHLLPKRDENDHRYWTHTQVYGSRGIIAWMERNDLRPGNLLADPEREEEHVRNLRRPKFLNGNHARSVRVLIDKGRTRESLVRTMFRRMQKGNGPRYATEAGLERALVQLAKIEGWTDFPKAKPKPVKKIAKVQKQEFDKLKRRVEQLEALVDDN